MKRKRVLVPIIIVLLLVLQSGVAAMASSNPVPEDMAVYLKEGFYGSSAIIEGSLYSAQGDVEFTSSTDNDVTGNIYHSTDKQFIIPQYYYPDFEARVEALSDTYYNETFPDLADFPDTDDYEYISSFNPAWDTPQLVVDKNTHFGNLVIKHDGSEQNPVLVDTTQNDVYIVADNISWGWGNRSIKVVGGGKLFLYIKNFNLTAPVLIDNGKVSDNTFIISKSNLTFGTLATDTVFYGNVIYTGMSSVTLKGAIDGSLFADTNSLSISSGDNIVNGLVYAPDAEVTLGSAGKDQNGDFIPNISGRLVAKKLTMSPTSIVRFVPNSANQVVPDELLNSSTPTIPDGNYKPGILGEYYDASELTNETTLKMKRIDPRIEFNFGYGSPDPVIEPENFSIRWTGFIKPDVTGNYTFKTYSDDGVRLKIGDKQIIDQWGHLSFDFSVAAEEVYLEAGKYYPITLEYQQMPLFAAVLLFWEAPNVPMGIVPASSFFVGEAVYDEYISPKFFNPLEKAGTGFSNKFYTPSRWPSGVPSYAEENSIYYEWGFDAPEGIDTDEFYGRLEGKLEAKFTEDLTLIFTVDDSIVVWVDGSKVIDQWGWNSREDFAYTFSAVAGQKYDIKIEYADKGLGATLIMGWESASIKGQTVPIEYMYPLQ